MRLEELRDGSQMNRKAWNLAMQTFTFARQQLEATHPHFAQQNLLMHKRWKKSSDARPPPRKKVKTEDETEVKAEEKSEKNAAEAAAVAALLALVTSPTDHDIAVIGDATAAGKTIEGSEEAVPF